VTKKECHLLLSPEEKEKDSLGGKKGEGGKREADPHILWRIR